MRQSHLHQLLRLLIPVLLLGFLAVGCSDEQDVVDDSTMQEAPTGVPGMPDNLDFVCGDLRVTIDPTLVPIEMHVGDESRSVRVEPTPTGGIAFVGTGATLTVQDGMTSLALGGEQYDCTPAEDVPVP